MLQFFVIKNTGLAYILIHSVLFQASHPFKFFHFFNSWLPCPSLPAGVSTAGFHALSVLIHLLHHLPYIPTPVSWFILPVGIVLFYLGIELTIRNMKFYSGVFIVTIMTDTMLNDFFPFFKSCFSSCFCHIDFLFRIVILKFSIGIIHPDPTS